MRLQTKALTHFGEEVLVDFIKECAHNMLLFSDK